MATVIFTLTNTSSQNQSADGVFVPVGGTATVSYLTDGIQSLITAGKLASSSNNAVVVSKLTDSSGGTASLTTIAAISVAYDQAEVANAIATLNAKLNLVIDKVSSIDAQVQETVTGSLPGVRR